MGRAQTYGQDMHRKAWELYAETKNMAKVSRTLGIAPMTLYRWADADFSCTCAFHNYEALENALKRANAARNELLTNGINDPVQHDLAMREQVALSGQKISPELGVGKVGDYPSMEIIRRNDAVIADFEYLYAKAWFLATGQVIKPEHAVLTKDGAELDYAALYEKGLKFRNLDEALTGLIRLRQEIDSRHDSGGTKVSLEEITTTKRVTLTLEQLTKAREQLLDIKKSGKPSPLIIDEHTTTDDQ